MRSNLIVVLLVASCGGGTSSDVANPDAAPVEDAPSIATTCAGKPTPARDDVWTIMSGGLSRVVNVHVPASYDPTQPTALVLNFHGFTSDALQEEALSKMNAKSDAAGFIAIYPNGTGSPRSWNAGACCGSAASANIDDIGFVEAILATAADELCIDPASVYATGMSNGGFLSNRIGCELADRFAAIAPVAGVIGVTTCSPSRPMPVIAFHGTADTLVPYDGNPQYGFPSVDATFSGWAARNGCTGAPVETFRQGDASCSSYDQCPAGGDVTLCTIDGGGHTWPGGLPVPAFGKTSTDLSATDAMWTFFEAHHLGS